MLAITIVLFVVPHNQQIVTIRQFFTCRISLFRNQNLNIEQKWSIPFKYRDLTTFLTATHLSTIDTNNGIVDEVSFITN